MDENKKYMLFCNINYEYFIVSKTPLICESRKCKLDYGDIGIFKVKFGYFKSECNLLCFKCSRKHKYKRADYKGEVLHKVHLTEIIPENSHLVDYTKLKLSDSKYKGREISVFEAVNNDAGIGTPNSNPTITNRCKVAFDPDRNKEIDHKSREEKLELLDKRHDKMIASENDLNNFLGDITESKPAIESKDKKQIGQTD